MGLEVGSPIGAPITFKINKSIMFLHCLTSRHADVRQAIKMISATSSVEIYKQESVF